MIKKINYKKRLLAMIVPETKIFKSDRSLAPRFFANSSLILTSSDFLTDIILQLNFADLFANSF